MEKKLIIYGIGKLAQYVGYVFENDSEYDVIAYCIEEKLLDSTTFEGKPLVKFEKLIDLYPSESYEVFIAVGNNKIRKRLYEETKEMSFSLASYVSSKAQFWPDLITGENVFIGEGSIIQPFVSIKNNTFIIGGRLGHHSSIGEHVLISGSTIGGNTEIGDFSFLGLNSAVSQNLIIGTGNLIGMNVTIERNTKENAVYSHKGTTLRKIDASRVSDRSLQ